MSLPPERSLQLGRITAGLPRLDPSKRFQNDATEATLDRQRAIHRQIEEKRDHAVRNFRGRDLTDLRAAIGIPLHSSKIIENLAKLNPSLDIRHHPWMPRFQIFRPDRGNADGWKYVCAFEDNMSPQFEIYHVEEEEHVKGYGKEARLEKVKVLKDTTRGWVPLLMMLIRKRLIPQTKTETVFGFVFGDIDVE